MILEFVAKFICIYFSLCREGLGEGYDGDIAFASALEAFGGGHNDPISVAFGGVLCPSSISKLFVSYDLRYIFSFWILDCC